MAKAKVKIRDNRTKWDKMIRTIRDLSKGKNGVEVGVFGESGSELVIQAATNEFGTDKAGKDKNIVIPERPFLRSTLNQQSGEIREKIDNNKVAIVTGRMKKRLFLSRLGIWFTGIVQTRIADSEFLKNAPSTVKSKKSNTPLIDTGRMRGAITHKVN